MKSIKLSKYSIAVIALSLIYFWLSTYKIQEIPIGYNVDEIGTALDAYYLANFGVDRYNMQFPIYFTNYGGGQNALNQYLCAVVVKLFGFNMVTLKMPGVLLNVIGFIYLVKLFKNLFNEKTALLVGAIYVISPYSIMRTRVILESNLAMPIMIIALYYTYRAIFEKKLIYWQIAGVLYGIVLWAYMYELLVLFMFLTTCLIYSLLHKKINIRQIVVFTAQFVIVTWPLILFNIINILGLNTIKIGVLTIPKLELYRSSELTSWLQVYDILGAVLVYLKTLLYSDWIQYNSTVFGVYYITSSLLAIYAIVNTFRNLKTNIKSVVKHFNFKFLISTLIVCHFVQQIVSLANCNKLSVQYIAMLMFMAIGLESLKKLQKPFNLLEKAAYVQYVILFLMFQTSYYSRRLYDNKPCDYSIADYREILEENNIDSYETLYQTQNKESLMIERILQGEDVTPEDYAKLRTKNFEIHTFNRQNPSDLKPGNYIIGLNEAGAKPFIYNLESLVNENKASEKVYSHYKYFQVY